MRPSIPGINRVLSFTLAVGMFVHILGVKWL